MKFIRELITRQGHNFESVGIFSYTTEQEYKSPRKIKRAVSSQKLKNQNRKNQEKHLEQLMNTNFTDEDYRLDLTYTEQPLSREEAKKDLSLFLGRLMYLYKKSGVTLKYIKVTGGGREKKDGSGLTRIHHHVIISGGVPRDDIEKLWKAGRKSCQHLQADKEGYAALARYLLKQVPESETGLAFSPSRNLKKPVEIRDDNKYGQTEMRKIIQAERDGTLKEKMEKLYKGWECVSCRVRWCEVTGQPNIYAKMRRKN